MRLPRPRRLVTALVATAVLSPVLASLPAPTDASAAAAPPRGGAAATRAAPTQPGIAWASCGPDLPGVECATLLVPLDHDAPRGEQIRLALARRPADDPAARLGSLLVNPGGPGGSGVDLVAFSGGELFTPAVRASFDLVGFAPGASPGAHRCSASAPPTTS